MKIKQSHFWYNKRQRNGILFLLILVFSAMSIYFFVDFRTAKTPVFSSEENKQLAFFQSQIDSLKNIELERRKPKIYPFNPSFLSDFRASKLGLSVQEIDRLLEHRKAGKYINSAKQFQQVTKINDSLLNVIKPYFKFPDWVLKRNVKKAPTKFNKQTVVNQTENTTRTPLTNDLNKATATDLKAVNGIGVKLSERIIKYRNMIGGFIDKEQLGDVYGLKTEVIENLFQKFQILSKPHIVKININTASFKEVLHLPYIDYELTKKIFNYRDEVAEIQKLEELKNIEGFPVEIFNRIALYLKAE